jgi:hypothetical protein
MTLPGYQPDHASARIGAAGLLSVLGLVALAALVAFGMYSAFKANTARPPATTLQRADLAPSGPRLESDPRKDRLALEAKGRKAIETWGWADAQRTRARVPIERAMALQAQQGWPEGAARGSPASGGQALGGQALGRRAARP